MLFLERLFAVCICRNLLTGDTFSGSWVTVGVLTEKGIPRTSSTGKTYCIWKIGCLDENTVSLFLFGDAYQRNMQEQAGTVFALFSCAVRKDTKVFNCYELLNFLFLCSSRFVCKKSCNLFCLFLLQGNGFSLSIYSPSQILKMGTSVDYGVCKGRRTDGMACTLVINKYGNK